MFGPAGIVRPLDVLLMFACYIKIMDHIEQLVEISRLQRAAFERAKQSMRAQQLGEDFLSCRLDVQDERAYISHTAKMPWQLGVFEMAKKPTKKEQAAAAASGRNLLAEGVAATQTGNMAWATEAELHTLLTDPRGALVEFNPNMRQGENVAFRATAIGVANAAPPASAPASTGGWASAPTSAPVQRPQAKPGAYALESGIPVPAPRRGGKGSNVYGFETMEVGQSFYIPADTENPSPAKRIASTVSSASKRLAPKQYVVRSVDETANGRGKGARVWRTE